MAGQRDELQQSSALRRAVALVTEAMDLLDAHGGVPDAAVHLAVAQQQMRQALSGQSN